MPAALRGPLGVVLVHAADARERPAARVRDAKRLQERLHGAVLAAGAVQADEGRVRRDLHQRPGGRVLDVQRVDLVAEALQGVLDACSRHEGDVPLHRGPAAQDDQARHAAPHPSVPAAKLGGAGALRGSRRRAGSRAPGRSELHALAHDLREQLDAAPDPLRLHEGEVEPHVVLARPPGVEALARHVGDVARYGPRQHRGRVEVRGQGGPHEEAALGVGPVDLLGHELGQGV